MKKILALLIVMVFSATIVFAETVVFNPNTLKYHSVNCPHAKRCKSCIRIDKKQAKARGGKPCKTCGG